MMSLTVNIPAKPAALPPVPGASTFLVPEALGSAPGADEERVCCGDSDKSSGRGSTGGAEGVECHKGAETTPTGATVTRVVEMVSKGETQRDFSKADSVK